MFTRRRSIRDLRKKKGNPFVEGDRLRDDQDRRRVPGDRRHRITDRRQKFDRKWMGVKDRRSRISDRRRK